MKLPYAIRSRGLVEEEERVDEIECKVFIKRCDSKPAPHLQGAGAQGQPVL